MADSQQPEYTTLRTLHSSYVPLDFEPAYNTHQQQEEQPYYTPNTTDSSWLSQTAWLKHQQY